MTARHKCCRECSKKLQATAKRSAVFCDNVCRGKWNNRRKSRGADLFDLFMSMRYLREDAKGLGVWTEMCRIAEVWHDEDLAAGRVSFESPAVVLERLKDAGTLPRARRQVVLGNKRM